MANKTTASTVNFNPYLVIITIIIFGAFSYYLFSYLKPQEPKETVEVSNVPSPTPYPLPKEETTFQVSGGSKTGPKPKSATFNPLAIENGTNQTISITLTDTANIREVKAKITTDNKTRDVTFLLKDGDPKNGTWQTNWLVDDTAEKIYKVDFRFVGSEVNDRFGYGFR